MTKVPASLVVFAGGGTGGHLYPALAVADELRRRCGELRFVFYGSQRSIDLKILQSRHAELVPQSLAPLSLLPWRWPSVFRSLRQARRICRAHFERDRPGIVIGTGGLASVPAVRAAGQLGIPTALFNPDLLPGKANRYLARSVAVVFAQFSESAEHLPRGTRVCVTGCPVRAEFLTADRASGIRRFGLDPRCRTLLVTGASQGALTINDAVLANVGFLAQQAEWQILHLTGEQDYERVKQAYQGCGLRSAVVAYTEHMADAVAAADLVIARAGASSLAELTALGRASILMPYPFHRDMHQLSNAQALVRRGAATLLIDARERSRNGPRLREVLIELMSNPEHLAAMGGAARRMGHQNAATEIAQEVLFMVTLQCGAAHRDSLQRSCSLAR